MEKLKIKFNNGNGAILCSGCSVILKVGNEFTKEELSYFIGEINYLPAKYCEKCSAKSTEIV